MFKLYEQDIIVGQIVLREKIYIFIIRKITMTIHNVANLSLRLPTNIDHHFGVIRFEQRPWDNFTNFLRAAFSYESVLSSFSVLTFRFANIRCKEIGAKAACKMLVKLTPIYIMNTLFHT